MIPLHVLHLKLVEDVMYSSKFLSFFGETPVLSEADLYHAEQYLANVWAGAISKPTSTTYGQLRLEIHIQSVVVIK